MINHKKGSLYIVGTGVGDVDNITIKASEIIKKADVIFAMSFVQERLSELIKGKEIYDAGHGCFTKVSESSKQEEKIKSIVYDSINAGKIIAVLDYGDPMVYSPQSGYLKAFADLEPVVIPGISSVNAANAALRKDISGNSYEKAIVITEAMENWQEDDDYISKLSATQPTMILLSMNINLSKAISKLKTNYPENTSVTIVFRAGYSEGEKVVKTTLESLEGTIKKSNFSWEYLIYIGNFIK